MVPNLFFNIFRKYTIIEKRIEEFVKIAIAVKCNRSDNTDDRDRSFVFFLTNYLPAKFSRSCFKI
jgi:hypothetical protein